MKTRFRSTGGITLIEMMITVVIIGIVSTMAVPRFQAAWEKLKIKGADRDIISTIRLARSMAITDKNLYGVYFDGNVQTMTLFKDIVNPSSGTYELGDSIVRVDSLPDEFTYLGTDMSDDVLIFRPNGSAGFTGGGNISAMASTESLTAILTHNVLASTGRILSNSSYY
jgi:prepilin-type N-terminal cleavage/methylation domain-containing protein